MVSKQDHFDRFIKLLRLTGAIMGLINIALGLYELISFSLNPRDAINAIYSILFGILMLVCEIRWVTVLKHFYFLQLFAGLGAFYIFVGGIALGGAWYQYVVGSVCIGVGIIYFVLGLACRRMGRENFRKSGLRTGDEAPLPPSGPPPSATANAANAAAAAPSPEGAGIYSNEGSPYGGNAYGNAYGSEPAYGEPAAIRDIKRSAYAHDPEMA